MPSAELYHPPFHLTRGIFPSIFTCFYLLSPLSLVWAHLPQATPIPGQDGSHYTLVKPCVHTHAHARTHAHMQPRGFGLGATVTSTMTLSEPTCGSSKALVFTPTASPQSRLKKQKQKNKKKQEW